MHRHDADTFLRSNASNPIFIDEVRGMPNRFVSITRVAYGLFVRSADALQSPFILAIRLYWGWQLAQSGWGKLHHIPQVTEFFTSLNIPFSHANAVFVSNLEFFGGILLILGLASRFTGLVLTVNMLVAYVTADREALSSIFSNPGKFYAADPYTFLFASLVVLIFGAGYLSFDAILARLAAERTPKVHTPWPTTTPANDATRI
jgi:putative oxidoreductase